MLVFLSGERFRKDVYAKTTGILEMFRTEFPWISVKFFLVTVMFGTHGAARETFQRILEHKEGLKNLKQGRGGDFPN